MSTPEQSMQTRARSPMAVAQDYFKKYEGQIAAALPKHLNADRMMRLALTSMSQSRKLAECDVKSLFGAIVVASQMGLEIGVAGQGYLVPYKGKATFVPGWQGIVDLVGRAGRSSCWTGAVFEGDEFEWALGDAPFVRHRPGGDTDPRSLAHVYAIGRVNGSQWPIIEVWTAERVWRHRDKNNKVGGDHYSFKHPEMYARKVVLLQVLKYLPKSIEVTAALELSHRVDEGTHATLDANFQVVADDDDGHETTAPASPLVSSVKRQSKSAAVPAQPNEGRPEDEIKEQVKDALWVAQNNPGDDPTYLTPEELIALIKDAENVARLDYLMALPAVYATDTERESVKAAWAERARAFAKKK